MDRRKLLDLIARIDLSLALGQDRAVFTAERKDAIRTARGLLVKLKSGVLRGDEQILLGEVWPLSTIGLILPAICAVETQGVPVQYESVAEDYSEALDAETGTEISRLADHFVDAGMAQAAPDETTTQYSDAGLIINRFEVFH